jgi:predicted NUDIX family phosphoesterase
MSVKHPQHILAIKKSHVAEFLNSDKSVTTVDFSKFFQEANEHLIVARRAELEKNEDYLQILPYVMVARAEGISNTGDLKFLTYYRPVFGGEEKLHGNASIGFGGHIDLNDVICDENSVISLQDTVLHSMKREIFEELGVGSDDLAGIVMGYRLITDYSNSVGRVHLGVVFMVTLVEQCIIVPEVLEVDFAGEFSASELVEMHLSEEIVLENWSKLLVEEVVNNPTLAGTCYFHFPSWSEDEQG